MGLKVPPGGGDPAATIIPSVEIRRFAAEPRARRETLFLLGDLGDLRGYS